MPRTRLQMGYWHKNTLPPLFNCIGAPDEFDEPVDHLPKIKHIDIGVVEHDGSRNSHLVDFAIPILPFREFSLLDISLVPSALGKTAEGRKGKNI